MWRRLVVPTVCCRGPCRLQSTASASEAVAASSGAAIRSGIVDALANDTVLHALTVPELCEAMRSALSLAPRKGLVRPAAELKSRLENPLAVKQLTGQDAADALEMLARVEQFGSKEPASIAVLTHLLNNLHSCPAPAPLKAVAALVATQPSTAAALLEAATPLVTAKADALSLRHAKLGLALAVQLKHLDRSLLRALSDRIVTVLKERKSPAEFCETVQFFAKAKYTPSSEFFLLWDGLPIRSSSTESSQAVATTATEDGSLTKQQVLLTLSALRELRRKPSVCHRVVEGLAEAARPFVPTMYVTEVAELVVVLADLRYVQRDVSRSALGIRLKNESKVFQADSVLVACADRVLALGDTIPIDLLKDLAYGFAAMGAHYFRLWCFFSAKVKAVAGEVDPTVLVGIVKHMAKAHFADESLWKRITPHLLQRINAMPAAPIGMWGDALLSTIISRRSQTNEVGEPVKGSLVLEPCQQILTALVRRLVDLLKSTPRTAESEIELSTAYRCVTRALDIFYPGEGPSEGHLSALREAREQYLEGGRGTPKHHPSTNVPKLDLQPADAFVQRPSAKVVENPSPASSPIADAEGSAPAPAASAAVGSP